MLSYDVFHSRERIRVKWVTTWLHGILFVSPGHQQQRYRPVSQIPQCIGQISLNSPFCNWNVYTCAHFSYKMVHCVIWDWCIVWLVQQVCWLRSINSFFSTWEWISSTSAILKLRDDRNCKYISVPPQCSSACKFHFVSFQPCLRALHVVARSGDVELAQKLICKQADVNFRTAVSRNSFVSCFTQFVDISDLRFV